MSESLGLELTKSSGNQWHDQSDNRGLGLRVSCKANPTTKRTWLQTLEHLREAIDMAAGTGQIPALAIEDMDGSQYVLQRLSDYAEVLRGDRAGIVSPVKRSERIRAAAATPLLRRQAADV